jgi:GNAT superfamily N-acetyltransferase
MSRSTVYLGDLKTLPGDALLAYRHEGLRGVWKALAARSFHRVFRSGQLIVFAHSLNELVDVPPPPGARITRATEQDWPALAALVGVRQIERFRSLQAAGRICLIAWKDTQALGYAWVALRIGPDVSLWPLPLELPERAAYFCNLYVVPSERRSGLGSALAAERLRVAREAGCTEGWRMVAPGNGASLRTVKKSSTTTRVVGDIRFVQVLGRSYARFTPAPGESV